MTRFTPLRDRIAIRRMPEEERKGLIIIPDMAKQKPQVGEVLAVGDGYVDEHGGVVPLRVKPGMRVLFGKYSGTDIKLNDEDIIIMREEDVLGIVEE
jgi:chaperonin GroES